MAQVLSENNNVFTIGLDLAEMDTLRMHASREGLSLADAMADVVDGALALLSSSFVKEEADARRPHTEDSLTILLHIMYPKEGPLSVFDGTEKGLIATMLLETLDLGVATVRHSRRIMEISHELERKNEGMGSGVPAIPVNGRGVDNVRSSGGTAIVEGEVQEQGTGTDRLPDSD